MTRARPATGEGHPHPRDRAQVDAEEVELVDQDPAEDDPENRAGGDGDECGDDPADGRLSHQEKDDERHGDDVDRRQEGSLIDP